MNRCVYTEQASTSSQEASAKLQVFSKLEKKYHATLNGVAKKLGVATELGVAIGLRAAIKHKSKHEVARQFIRHTII